MNEQNRPSIIPLIGTVILGTAIVLSLNREPVAKKWYTAQCKGVIKEEWKQLDEFCGAYTSTATSIDYRVMKGLINTRDEKLKSANCEPKCEIWYCYPGYKRHYGAM